jgi:hypothetical protein
LASVALPKTASPPSKIQPVENKPRPERNQQNQQQRLDAHVWPPPICCNLATSQQKNGPRL